MQQQGLENLMTNVQQVPGIGILSPELAQPMGNQVAEDQLLEDSISMNLDPTKEQDLQGQ
jgi:hypothetical protein